MIRYNSTTDAKKRGERKDMGEGKLCGFRGTDTRRGQRELRGGYRTHNPNPYPNPNPNPRFVLHPDK